MNHPIDIDAALSRADASPTQTIAQQLAAIEGVEHGILSAPGASEAARLRMDHAQAVVNASHAGNPVAVEAAIRAAADAFRDADLPQSEVRLFLDSLSAIEPRKLVTTLGKELLLADGGGLVREDGAWRLDTIDLMKHKLSPARYYLDRIIPANTLTAFLGASQSMKSFFMVECSLALALGEKALGEFTAPTPTKVVLCLTEGQSGVFYRFAAALVARGLLDAPDGRYSQADLMQKLNELGIYVVRKPFALGSARIVDGLPEAMEALGAKVLFYDTFARGLGRGGMSENSNDDMNIVMGQLEEASVTGQFSTVVVHHVGHAETAQYRARGASAFGQALESSFLFERDDDTKTITVTCLKAKESEPGWEFFFRWNVTEFFCVGTEGEEIPATSLSLQKTTHSPKAVKNAGHFNNFQIAVRTILTEQPGLNAGEMRDALKEYSDDSSTENIGTRGQQRMWLKMMTTAKGEQVSNAKDGVLGLGLVETRKGGDKGSATEHYLTDELRNMDALSDTGSAAADFEKMETEDD